MSIHVPAVSVFSPTSRPMFLLIAMDMQLLFHLRSLPFLGRMIGSAALQEVQKRGQRKAFSSVTRDDKINRLAADYHSFHVPGYC